MKYFALLILLSSMILNSMQREKRIVIKKVPNDTFVSAVDQSSSAKCLKCCLAFANNASLNMHYKNWHPSPTIKPDINVANHSV